VKIILIIAGCIIVLAGLIFLWVKVALAKAKKKEKQLEVQHQLSKEKQHLLAYGGMLATYRAESPRILHIKLERDQLKEGLETAWGILNRDDALNTLEWLIEQGHRIEYDETYLSLKAGEPVDEEQFGESKKCYEEVKAVIKELLKWTDEDFRHIQTIAAWDYDRAVNIARWSYALGYITEEEVWSYIKRAATQASQTFENWKSYYISFAFGRAIAYKASAYDTVYGTEDLMKDQNSIWNEFPFKLKA